MNCMKTFKSTGNYCGVAFIIYKILMFIKFFNFAKFKQCLIYSAYSYHQAFLSALILASQTDFFTESALETLVHNAAFLNKF